MPLSAGGDGVAVLETDPAALPPEPASESMSNRLNAARPATPSSPTASTTTASTTTASTTTASTAVVSRRRVLLGSGAVLGGAAAVMLAPVRAEARPQVAESPATPPPVPPSAPPSGAPVPAVTVGPDQARYASLSTGFNQRFTGTPACIAVVTTQEQCLRAVEEALDQGKRITVRGGGHCYEGFVSDNPDGVIIDVSGMRAITQGDDGAVGLQSGCTNWDVYELLYKSYGVTVPAGSCYSVGLGGHVVGGGYGLLSRQHGLSVDFLEAVDVIVVDADRSARLVHARRGDAETGGLHGEQVMEHEGQAFGRGQGVEHDEQGQAHRVGQHSLPLGIRRPAVTRRPARRLTPGGQGFFTAGAAGAQHVQAHPSRHRGQPAAQVLHRTGVRTAEANPRLLHGVVGLGP